MNAENVIQPALLKLFEEGKTEIEAYKDISSAYSSYVVSQNTVNMWYKKFMLENSKINDLKATNSKKKFTDEHLIDLINKNPGLNITELSKIAGASVKTISNRIKQIYSDEELEKHFKKYNTKFTDEFLISLVSKNPKLTMVELARLAGVSYSTISTRIKQINSTGKKVKYVRKKYKPDGFGASNPKLTDEYIINLVNENPSFNLYELAKLANVSHGTILNKINQINESGKIVNYIKKNRLLFTNEFLIDLINENPDLNLENLGKLADSSSSAVKYRLRKINSNGKILIYTSKKPGSKSKFTNEYLTEMVDENPNLNMTELAKLANVSVSTISKRIKQANSSGEVVGYISKTSQKDKLRQEKRLKFTNEFLIELIKENPSLNMTELAKLANVSVSTISRRIDQVNSNEGVDHSGKIPPKDKLRQGKKLKFTNEFLIELINENPSLNMTELAKLANVSVSTISKRIKKVNSKQAVVGYTSKRSQKDNPKQEPDTKVIN
jgi:DeoR/GlpR family transcriptional regulator of sugar metabolism